MTIKDLALKFRKMQRQAVDLNQRTSIVNLDDIPSPKVKEPMSWTRGLSKDDEEILLRNKWLNDKLVNAGQELIRAVYPNVSGLQDTSLGQTLAFNVQKGEFIQILHTGKGHWITITTIGCGSGCVDVYDSMPPSVTTSLTHQVASLLLAETDITLRYVALMYIILDVYNTCDH